MRNGLIRGLGSLAVLSALGVVLLAGCLTSRSISRSGYPGSYAWMDGVHGAELSEFSVLGVDPCQSITEADISAQFAARAPVKLRQGAALLLIQSGALFPDEPMQRELGRSFRVGPFSGIPPAHSPEQGSPGAAGSPASTPGTGGGKGNYAKALRLVAAEGGYDYILCYWGVLEAEQSNLATKGVSWVPIVGRAVPDEAQQMRIRLKAIIVDARTGQWTMIATEPISGDAVSAHINRRTADQAQVAQLKEKAYTALAEELRTKYTQ